MLISDDYAGAVYRVTYSPQSASVNHAPEPVRRLRIPFASR